MSSKYYLTTAIPYVNAAPHIGHALEFIEADALVRAKRLLLGKENVYFLSGADENAIKNVQAAEAAGMTPQEFVDRNSGLFEKLLKDLNISNDDFIRTTETRHVRGAQALWRATDPRDVYKKSYSGLYCTGCEQFYKPEELKDGKECYEHPGKPLEVVTEENYFFRLSKYGEWLKGAIASGELLILPETRRNEMTALLDQGLEDFSISRPKARTKGWGVPVPGDESQVMYVWYDALANYVTALGYPEPEGKYKEFWLENEARGHLIGKGINRFHTLYWPAMLKSAGVPVPRFVLVHGYLTIEGQKMSKSLGNVIAPAELIEEFGAEALRFYLLHEVRSEEDGDVSREKMREAYNAYLANGLGNLAARILKMALTNDAWPELPLAEQILAGPLFGDICAALDRFAVQSATEMIWSKISEADSYIQAIQPFKLVKTEPEKGKDAIKKLVGDLWEIAVVLEPFLPETSQKIQAAIRERQTPPVLFPRKA